MAPKVHVNFSSGEAIEDADFLQLQTMLRAQFDDRQFGLGGWSSEDYGQGSVDRDLLVWALEDGGACYPDTVALSVKVLPGWIAQWLSGVGPLTQSGGYVGDEPLAVAYHIDPAELDTLHDIGSAADRWDLVSIQLSPAVYTDGDAESRHFEDAVTRAKSSASVDKRQRITITKTLTKGASGGGIPALPGGHVPLYVIKIPAGHNAVFAPSASFPLYDHRMPLGCFSVEVSAITMVDRSAYVTNWTKSAAGTMFRYAVSNNGGLGDQIGFVPELGGHGARLVAVSALIGADNNLTQFEVVRFNPPDGDIATAVQCAIMNTALRGDPTAPATEYRTGRVDSQMGNPMGDPVSLPIWAGGWPNAFGQRPEQFAQGTDDKYSRVGMRITTVVDTARLHLVRFHFAGTP